MYNSYFSPVSGSNCECKKHVEKQCERPFEPFIEKCFEPRHKDDNAIQVQMINNQDGVITTNTAIKFDTIVDNFSKCLSYSTANGIFTIAKPGIYTLSWQLDTASAGAATEIDLSLLVDGMARSVSASPLLEGQISGTAILKVYDDPVQVSLINSSTDSITLSATVVQGNMVIASI